MAGRFATSSISSPYRVMLACEVNALGMNSNEPRSPAVSKLVSSRIPCVRPAGGHPAVSASQFKDEDRIFVSSAEAIIPWFAILYNKGA